MQTLLQGQLRPPPAKLSPRHICCGGVETCCSWVIEQPRFAREHPSTDRRTLKGVVRYWRRGVRGKVQLPLCVTVSHFRCPDSSLGMALPHASIGRCFLTSVGLLQGLIPGKRGYTVFPVGVSVWTPIDSLQLDLAAATAVRFRVQYLIAKLDCNRRVGLPEGPARLLFANPWTDYTSIWCFFGRQVERMNVDNFR